MNTDTTAVVDAPATLRGTAVARMLGISYRTLMRYPHFYPPSAFGENKLRRWIRADVERWLREKGAAARKECPAENGNAARLLRTGGAS